MNQRTYVKAVAKHLACSKARRDEFVRDLESDIASALAAGEAWEQVEARMGDPRQVAQEVNEDLSEQELAAGRRRKRLKTAGIASAAVIVVVAVLVAATWWAMPKSVPVGGVGGHSEEEIVAQAQKVVTLLDGNDFDALRAMSDEAMASALSEDGLAPARTAISKDWGAFVSFGNAYLSEVAQGGQSGVRVQLSAAYENVAVVYTIVLDNDLRLIGLFMM